VSPPSLPRLRRRRLPRFAWLGSEVGGFCFRLDTRARALGRFAFSLLGSVCV
jgi:hypothetical protein